MNCPLKRYLNVPYLNRAEAKRLGAKWDPEFKQWYAPRTLAKSNLKNYKTLLEKWRINDIELFDEDRTFGKDKVTFDGVPRSCWFKSARSAIFPDDWERFKKYMVKRTDSRCEWCGIHTDSNGLSMEIHERWSYDDERKVMKLRRFLSLCNKCHLLAHICFTKTGKMTQSLKNWYKEISGDDDEEMIKKFKEAISRMKMRNGHNWKVDLTIFKNSGISLVGAKNEGTFKEITIDDIRI